MGSHCRAGSIDLISNEGIATVGLLGAVSGHASGCPCVILCSAGLLCSGVGPCSIVFASGLDSVCGPLTNEEVGLGPSSSGPVASRPPLGLGLLRRPGRCCVSPGHFHALVFHAWGLASGFSGRLTSQFERLVSLQGASDSMAHFSPEGVVVFSGSGIAVRVLLLATSLTLTIVIPLALGRICPSLPFPDGSLSLRCLF